ncbi:T-complex protein 11-like protein 1 [Camellia lanceoleosa]|uniref:T-complex protein 11-like protein 1 n=1 Tax=Camellia lanceoleosa TaxID=1840588 RepID=A0ACC0IQE4_9ERIC|nr:T-complex protein 11-like protein 1 [Camellia lanceoleosa]
MMISMAVAVDSPETSRVSGVAMEFPATDDTASPPRIPRRLRRRLLETKTSPSTVEEIEAKLRDADLRRQKFYENLSSKARPKPRSPSQSSSHEEDLGQRLEAKLQAAEQKRLSILAKAQMRLAKLDELRQAAKTGVEMRFKKERAELGTKVESRVQQAEANRMLILKAYRQRRATLKERTSQSLLRRMARENKYKERVRAAISQKRAAAEKKRLGLLEEEKKRARARMLQVRKIAKSVSYQREIERRKMQDKLEDKLQRAKRQRAEYLSQRRRLHNSVHVDWNMHKQADLLSRKLARCWRRFVKLKKTTLDLAKAYDALNINERCMELMPFEQLARRIGSSATLQTVKALLDRLESRYKLSKPVVATSNPSSWDDIDHLLKRVVSPNRRRTPRKSPTQSKDAKRPVSVREVAKSPVKLSRYQVRVVLCAYMILGHPDAVFSGQGEREIALAKSAEKFVREFELLMKIILNGPIQNSDEVSDPEQSRRLTFKSQLAAFDAAWCSYLNSFVAWKVKDALLLEEDLVKAACHLELSMIQKCKMTPDGDSDGDLTHDMKAIQKQVTDDQKLLREKVRHLSGDAGIERMECALSDTRTKYFQAKENGNHHPVGSPPIMHIPSPNPPISPAFTSISNSDKRGSTIEGIQKPSPVVRSLFQDDYRSPLKEVSSSASSSSMNQLHESDEKLAMENELMVNEVLHELTFADSLNVTPEDQSSMKAKIKETMEKAFWDDITESMKQDEPNYDRVVELMREVRDGFCEMAPQSWKEEIFGAFDLDILSQVLNLGKLDMDYLGKILDFALITLQKLSAPAKEDELKVAHLKLLKELAKICRAGNGSNQSYIVALIKGLRFVLEQIQALKQEISKARIKIMQPLLKGPAGLEYLKNAFAKHHGPPSDASTALPLTTRWLSSVWDSKDQEWHEHTNALLELTRSNESSSQRLLLSTTLRTGGSIVKTSGSQLTSIPSTSKNATNATGSDNKLECKGEKVDLLVRLGLLKLVTGVSGLTQEALPETLKLNLSRLRAVQAQLQKIIVISTSILVLRQTLLSEQIVRNPADLENIILSCVKQLSELLDSVEDAGIKEITELLGTFTQGDDKAGDTIKLESRKNVMARLLMKSLQAGDPIFVRVSRAVYLAVRGVVLGGNGPGGRALAEMALRQVGAASLLDMVMGSSEVVLVAATVSCDVHGPWYVHLIEKM